MSMAMYPTVLGSLRTAEQIQQAAKLGRPVDPESLAFPGLPKPAFRVHQDINWKDFNYPPFLRLVHYEPEELPVRIGRIARGLCLSFRIVFFTCTVNMVDTLVIALLTKGYWRCLLQSIIHVILLPVAAFLVFYAGYRGLAEPDRNLRGRFIAGQIVLALLCLLMTFVPFGCVNGLSKWAVMESYTAESNPFTWVYWSVAVVVESAFFFSSAILGAANVARVRRYDGTDSAAQ
mmetsp:Transcript_85056/g.147555  ORF Transcript_85056/g.147555 Transcript_85056/m.147555 type:complete len:233 (+) Transcript_85056:29-727(+)